MVALEEMRTKVISEMNQRWKTSRESGQLEEAVRANP
jgi:hypothetical protein